MVQESVNNLVHLSSRGNPNGFFLGPNSSFDISRVISGQTEQQTKGYQATIDFSLLTVDESPAPVQSCYR